MSFMPNITCTQGGLEIDFPEEPRIEMMAIIGEKQPHISCGILAWSKYKLKLILAIESLWLHAHVNGQVWAAELSLPLCILN